MNLISVDDLTNEMYLELFGLTEMFIEVSTRPIPKVPTLRGKTLATVFFENSTRTRLSFETAAKRLSADTLSFSASTSSLSKGESLFDTINTLDAIGVDFLVVRHSRAGTASMVANWTQAAVINAGDGCGEHPTQSLIDCATLVRRFAKPDLESLDRSKTINKYLSGLKIAIVGDVLHSRVARSNIKAFTNLGAKVTLVGPPTLIPDNIESWPVDVCYDLDQVISEMDVIYLLRMQNERFDESMVPSTLEYSKNWGLDMARLKRLGPDGVIMHPGPINRGVELTSEVADSTQSLILDQVRHSVPVRMAILAMLANLIGGGHE